MRRSGRPSRPYPLTGEAAGRGLGLEGCKLPKRSGSEEAGLTLATAPPTQQVTWLKPKHLAQQFL